MLDACLYHIRDNGPIDPIVLMNIQIMAKCRAMSDIATHTPASHWADGAIQLFYGV